MTYTHLSLALLGLLLTADVDPARTESLVRKCRNVTQREPVLFLDGLVYSSEAFKAFDEKDIESVEVTCVSPVDSTRLKPGTVTAGLPAIIVWSKSGPASALKPALSMLVAAQDAHFARTGGYARDLTTLGLSAAPREVKLSLEATPTGWSARSWVDRRFSPRCSVFVGNVEVPPSLVKDAIVCREG
jgi:hypothetical protein